MPLALSTQAGGSPGTSGIIAFGASKAYTGNLSPAIDAAGIGGMAFLAPRDITVIGINAMFSVSKAATISSPGVTVFAELYHACDSNQFAAVPFAKVALTPALSGDIQAGHIVSGCLGRINARIGAGERLLLIFYISGAGTSVSSETAQLEVYASAGVLYN
jgi:BclB C-terminal domain-containing protein